MIIKSQIETAKKILATNWPLQSFIATNPLWMHRNECFFDLMQQLNITMVMDINFYQHEYQSGNIDFDHIEKAYQKVMQQSLSQHELHVWINHSFEQNYTQSSQKNSAILYCDQIDEYAYQAPKQWIKDKFFHLLKNYYAQKKQHKSLVDYALATSVDFDQSKGDIKTIEYYLSSMGIAKEVILDYFRAIFLELYGWASFINWELSHPNNPWVATKATLEDIIRLWLHCENIIYQKKQQPYHLPQAENAQQINWQFLYIWQCAYEQGYIDNLYQQLLAQQPVMAQKSPVKAQLIFCIDTRSEGIRRQLEAIDHYETYGCAGFFGTFFQLHNEDKISYQAPALIENPDKKITATYEKVHWSKKANQQLQAGGKNNLFSPFAFFEMIGFWKLLNLTKNTFFTRLIRKESMACKLHIAKDQHYTQSEQIQAAYAFLTSIGLTDYFAATVIIVGHESNNTNNPYQSSLDCGACGGNSGTPNAILMCQILNDSVIRKALTLQGIQIGQKTVFIAACHHTTNDRIELMSDIDDIKLQQDLILACDRLKSEKSSQLPGFKSLEHRELDWSELIPELGLANNAAFVIGRRDLTKKINLNRRVFLHSYDAAKDKDGAILSAILSGPGVVTHWINAQYYFSTVNPKQFGAGNKAVHNVIPDIGVIEGNLSDLKFGLPQQSIYYQNRLLHEPRRLLVIVDAPQQRLDIALESSPDFKALVDNGWIYLKRI
ncbi:putative inorganic carbon transporter subunit DabA [Cysteiniphilum halobium]|uniref:putative inorganic carbon transporter subunit DabA n=1 Tax=Cysteiniphilum halobium TaxID=2219059 RepID=UPI003F875A58